VGTEKPNESPCRRGEGHFYYLPKQNGTEKKLIVGNTGRKNGRGRELNKGKRKGQLEINPRAHVKRLKSLSTGKDRK